MFNRKLRMKLASRGLGTLAVLALLLTTWFGAATSVTAQANGGIVIGASLSCNNAIECGPAYPEYSVQVSVTTEDEEFLGTCTVRGNLNDRSHVPACSVSFPFQPTGTLIVTEDVSTLPLGYAPVENPIYVEKTQLGRASHDVGFSNVPDSGSTSIGRTSDVAIATMENGVSVIDACYVLLDFSNEGCDENADGQVSFQDIPFGTYTVRQTADLGPDRSVDDFTIEVTGDMGPDGYEVFSTSVTSGNGGVIAPSGSGGNVAQGGAVDISLITRDPDDGTLLRNACYVLVDHSNEGCDENADGQVTFDDISAGTYTVRQTHVPAGYPQINDFQINVEPVQGMPGAGPFGVPLGFIVKQAPEQNAPDSRNVSVVLLDMKTHEKVAADVCVELVGASNIGCDEDLIDGQIDFLDVPAGGPYELRFSNLPAGYDVGTVGGPLAVSIDAELGAPSNRMIFVLLAVPQSGTTGSGSGAGSIDATAATGTIAVVGGQTGATSTTSTTSASDTASTGVAVELILDTSDSMNERDQDGQTRIEVAKTVTTRLVTETLPPGVPVALRTYSECSSSLTMPMQPLDPNMAAATIAGLSASGNTPIAQSLREASTDLASVSGPKIIVLVTDGEETCDGDPKAAIEALVAQDVTVQVNIVGFAIDDAALAATFQEWARVGNGTYYQASNELELDQAVTTASQLPFHVIDQQGMVVADGTVDGTAVSVAAGTYTVEIDTVPVTRHENVVVTAQETTMIDLNAGATIGSGSAGSADMAGSRGSAASEQETWTASVQVSLCDAPPGSGSAMNCHDEGGTVVNISLASGEWMGSCTGGDPQPTPWNTSISTCTVEGLPFNADFVATQDPSTIPAGYAPYNDLISLHVENVYPGGGDQATFTFFDILTDAGASTSGSSVLDPNNSAEATILMTFRGCPEGFEPNTDDFYAECTIPLDAPDASFMYWGGDGHGGMNITGLDRQYDGAYIYVAGPNTMNVDLYGLAPVVRDQYRVFGADSEIEGHFICNLVSGETREIFVFYYFE